MCCYVGTQVQRMCCSQICDRRTVQRHGVAGAGLKELKGLKSLRVLHLTGISATDRTLTDLQAVTSLRELRVRGPFSTAGVKKLQEALPGCRIYSQLVTMGNPLRDPLEPE
jgi:hypothetical protein